MGLKDRLFITTIKLWLKGTRFRPLSLNIPKPLFPFAGQPMVHHPITACKRVSAFMLDRMIGCSNYYFLKWLIPNLAQIYLVGFYEEREFAVYVSSISNELRVPVSLRYIVKLEILERRQASWFCWWAYNFRDIIMEDSPSQIFLLSCDVCCSFPLPEMLEAHRRYRGMGTILVSKVSAESASQFGELVADPNTNEFSDKINCGVYGFTPDIFNAIQDVSTHRKDTANLRRVSSFEALQSATKSLPSDFVRFDQDILTPLAGKKQLYVYETMEFWEQMRTPGVSQFQIIYT
ncbi:hypothetical protein Cgig2_004195 [Carnegiea gigantea]|uniref:Nucleotidyl transferase domain-containing protein n=1 Tax=Carnegiea gigantea TaxID=171969 RepID=A0A9Q1KU59_9CARY|nr:hypothetical protein Cgig2_004195 [Carnegiea gigantea]